MIKKVLFCLIVISLTFISYFNLIGNPSLPTWRLFNILFVFASFFLFFKLSKDLIQYDIIISQIVFVLALFLQSLHLLIEDDFKTYEMNFMISVLFLLGFVFYFYVLKKQYSKEVINVLIVSFLINFIYQLFQFFSFLFGKPKWVVILNQPDVVEKSNIYRILGPFLGPPGFMSESGQLALFFGPLLIYLLIIDYYKVAKINKFIVSAILLSLFLTLSGGAFIQFSFIGLTFVLLNWKKLFNLKFLSFLILIVIIITIMLQNEQYYKLVEYRIMSIFTGDSSRLVGASIYMQVFYENFLFGLAPKASRFIDSDPNTFIPILLADHGLIAGGAFLFMYFVPIILAFIRSTRKFYVIPFAALTVHLFMAYGTYSWPFIWIIYVLVIEGLDNVPQLRQKNLTSNAD